MRLTLAQFYPPPRKIRLAGVVVTAREWRVKEVARADRWLASAPDPLAQADESSPEYPRLLRDLYESSWPPSFGMSAAHELLFGTAEGRAIFLRLTLRGSSPEILGACAALACAMTDGELDDLCGVAFGDRSSFKDEVIRRIDRHLGFEPFEAASDPVAVEQEPVTWGQVIAELCTILHITPGQAGGLYLSQVHAIRSAGSKEEDRGDPVPSDQALYEEVMAKRFDFWRPFHERHLTPEEVAERAAILAQAAMQGPAAGPGDDEST